MFRLSRKLKICSIILILLIVIFSLALRPLQKKFQNIVTTETQKLNALLLEKAGMQVRYESFSPSILTNLKINNVSCVNNKNEVLASIKKLDVKYSIFKVISGDYSNIIRSLSIDGVHVELDKIIDTVLEVVRNNREKETKDKPKYHFDFKPIYNIIPTILSIKNFYLIYNNRYIDSSYYLSYLSITNFKRRKNLAVEFQGKMNLLVKAINLNVDGNVFLSGTATDSLENSTAKVIASDFDVYGFKIEKQTVLASYSDYEVKGHSIQTLNPLYVYGSYHFKEMFTRFGFKTDKLAPTKVFSTKEKVVEEIVKDFRLSVKADGIYRIKENTLDFSSNGNVYVPPKYIPKGINVDYDLEGNLNHLNINHFHANGSLLEFITHLDFTYRGLKLDGDLNLLRYSLPNQNIVSSQLYFTSLNRGFSVFAPKVYVGTKVLTAMQADLIPQNDSIDFEFEVTDYLEDSKDSEKGLIDIGGSYIIDSKYATANVTLNNLSSKSVVEYVQQFVSSNTQKSLDGIKNFISPYVFSSDVYLSSDLSSISYNVPYLIVANTQKDNQYLFTSVDGNNTNVQINRFDLILGSFASSITGALDYDIKTSEAFFTLDTIISSIPYHLNGSYSNKAFLLTGDYDTQANIELKKDNIRGTLKTKNLPISLKKLSLIFSLDTMFTYNKNSGPIVTVNNFEVEKSDISSSVNPKLSFNANATKYGAKINSIIYSDKYSTLIGNADVNLDLYKNIVNSLGVDLSLQNKTLGESISVKIEATNPEQKSLSVETLIKDFYINSNIDIKKFALSRFTSVKNDNNSLSLNLSLTGTLEHPYATASLDNLSFLLGNSFVQSKGNFLLEDRLLTISDAQFMYPSWGVESFSGTLDLQNFDGKFNALFSAGQKNKELEIPINLSVYDSFKTTDKFLPDVFSVTLSVGEISGNLVKKSTKFELTANYSPEIISLFSSDNIGLVGSYIPETGELFGSVNSENIASFELGGFFNIKKLDVELNNLNIDLKQLSSYFNFDNLFKIENGLLEGNMKILGTLDTPEFVGRIDIQKPRFYAPSVFKNVVSSDKISLIALNNELTLENQTYSIKNSKKFDLGAKIVLNKWFIELLDLKLKTLKRQELPINFKNSFIVFKGDISCDLNLLYENSIWNFLGSINGEDVELVLDAEKLATSTINSSKEQVEVTNKESMAIYTDLKLRLGTHVLLNFKPFLRCILSPNTVLNLKLDTNSQSYQLDGDVKVKSGEIAYLQRNFYIKDGNIKFNPINVTNPLITIRAETREKDSKNQQVKIILTVDNQYLQSLNPKFSSVPAKSESEILSLLGQVMLANSDDITDVLASVGEYYIQSKIMYDIENKLRDLLNFDIFSVKTNFLQNTINLSTLENSQKENITLGNFFDNTTVYIGKYLGSSLYFDAMLNLSIGDKIANDISKTKGLLLKPEIGLEIELPIANIRWSMAPDINALLNNQYVPSTSVSLSWSFSF